MALNIKVIVGSVREGRVSLPVAQWIAEVAGRDKAFDIELVDLKDWDFPMFALKKSPAMGLSDDPLQQRWAKLIGSADGFIWVSPEYNHGPSAVLKNALDYVWTEWNRKPVAFVSFGNAGGARAVEQLRGVSIELRMAPLGEAVHIMGVWDKIKDDAFAADERDAKAAAKLIESLAWWGKALKAARD